MALRPFFLNLMFYLSSGAFLYLALAGKNYIPRNRFLLHGFLAVFFAFLSLSTISQATPLPLQWGLAGFSVSAALFLLSTLFKFRGSRLFYLLALGSTLFVIAFEVVSRFHDHPDWSFSLPALMTNAFLSTGLLGGAIAFLFWQPAPYRLVGLFLFFLFVRFFFSTYLATSLLQAHDSLENFRFFLSYNPGLIVFARWLWGIAAPLLLAVVLLLSLPKTKGLFYLMLLFVLTGESLGLYLALFHHLAV